jgi:RHS repeat-associated protein
MDYGPFGENLRVAIKFPTEQFAQLARDAESGQDYAEARNYSPGTGRLNRVDPIYNGLFDPQQWNRYTYAANNPLRFVDARGLCVNAPSTDTGSSICADLNKTRGGTGTGPEENDLDGTDDELEQGGQSLPGTPVPIPTAPPVPVPTLPAGTPPDLTKAFEDSFREFVSRVVKPACGQVFGGTQVALNAMYNSYYAFIDLGGPKFEDGTWTLTGAFVSHNPSTTTVFLNTRGPFSNLNNPTFIAPGMSSPGVFDLGTGFRGPKLGGVMLLHEAGHVVGKFGKDTGKDKWKNPKHTAEVLKGCF